MSSRLCFDIKELVAGIHLEDTHPQPTHSPFGREYLPWSDPRAQRAFCDAYREQTGREWDRGNPMTGAA